MVYQPPHTWTLACPHAKLKRSYKGVKRNGKTYEMQPIYMNATKCKMLLPTWLNVNTSSKGKYKLNSTNSNHKMKYK